jgi:hypothetical protein
MCGNHFGPLRFALWTWPVLLTCFLFGTADAPAAELQAREILPRYRPTLRVAMDVLVRGRPLPTVAYGGKTYLPIPRVGEEYQIRVSNHGPRRIVAIVSLDGLSVINGKPASERSPGYLVEAYGHVLINGWRRNLQTEAAFRFVDREKSYAARVGRPENIGVIGLVAFEELTPRIRWDLEKGKAGPLSSAKRLASGVGGVGTEYGRDVDSPASHVPFVRSANKRTVTFSYDTEDALRRAGVPIPPPSHPVPFPGDGDFAPPPPGHR